MIPVNNPIRPIPPAQREALRAELTMRSDILMRYGEPDVRLDGDRVLAYRWTRERALIILGYSGFALHDSEAVLLEFDAAGTLKRLEVVHAWQDKTIAQQAAEWARSGEGH